MKVTIKKHYCENCGKEFIDNYEDLNDYNARVYCNDCIDQMWEWKWRKQQKEYD